ncbi:hypothetical protein [Acetivibrio clariflavus]|uniref:Uncharacterized protein n=1 Tax=Acetivibrio clariflavus (strain DSM 19732 / NBRC 101661 / EBR45) TaxID=720554 RepID=G8M2X0_ACECE|nr:hypothetical protein [Acetivibrio clariflavus]AEV68230.1 hypothetical protein Clocl_1596 [Acetivibrio clariflavus DSM 19732]AEV68234.1 hypothetical protein Clocl_1602 [Acetivibrio clariflavus DSM 19732]AEV68273.1 hypothetical protein Clocl_1650 [Acetivibrio clariflavus DSM 19732]
MSVSIYYTARRNKPLTKEEQQAIDSLIKEYSVEKEISEYLETGKGFNWEPFCVYGPDPSEPDIIFEGSTRLPDNSKEAIWEGLQHWSLLLSAIRCVIPDAKWNVHVNDHELIWDEEYSEYDLSK